MESKSTLEEMKSFYHSLDYALNNFIYFAKKPEAKPISVGGDAVYMKAEEELGNLSEMIEKCEKRFHSLLNKKLLKKLDYSDSRWSGTNRPLFGDADIYMTSLDNTIQMDKALRSLGYNGNMNDLNHKGCAVFLNKHAYPVKVEIMSEKGGHCRPRSDKPVGSIIPKGANFTTLKDIDNILFIDPRSFAERVAKDAGYALRNNSKIPVKMLEDFYFIETCMPDGVNVGISDINDLAKRCKR